MNREKIVKWYRNIALVFFNAMLLFLVINLISIPFLNKDKETDLFIGREYYKKAYPQYKESETRALLSETWLRGFIYDPYQCYREGPYTGKYVNVSAQGYRKNEVSQREIEDSSVIPVFLFGGSTTFGYGISDSVTIAAFLTKKLREINPSYCVYNFGAGGYFSNQEAIWFKRSLTVKNKPVIAIFMDGLNDLNQIGRNGDDPLFAGPIRHILGVIHFTDHYSAGKYLSNLPAIQLFSRMKGRDYPLAAPSQENPDTLARRLVERYKSNCRTEKAIADLYGIKTLFVIQPVPQYDYDLDYHAFKGDFSLDDPYIKAGYPQLKTLCADTSLQWLWLGEMQHGIRKNLYVNNVHYNPEMDSLIAKSIFQRLRSMVPSAHQH